MRKRRRESARKREASRRSARSDQVRRDAAGENREAGLEDDGFVFWPTSLGEPAGPRLVQVEKRPRREPDKARPPRRRLATTVLFAFLFFAGAALTAAAGNEVATIVSSSSDVPVADTQSTTQTLDATTTDTTTATTTATTTDTTPAATTPTTTTSAEPSATTTTSTDASSEPGQSTTTTTSVVATTADTVTTPAPSGDQSSGGNTDTPRTTTTSAVTTTPEQAPSGDAGNGSASSGSPSTPARGKSSPPKSRPAPVLAPQPSAQSAGHGRNHKHAKQAKAGYASLHSAPKLRDVEPEAGASGGSGTVQWINEPLPDPTPASLRLTPEFAQQLQQASSAEGLDWAFLLAVLRAEHPDGSGQVALTSLQQEAAVLGPLHVDTGDRAAVFAYKHDALFDRRVLVLEHYYEALGLQTLVDGLAASKDSLAAKVLSDPRIDIYPGGRDDISSGRVDVRVIAMIAFLAESFGDVRVSCLITGHRLYARPGVISAHIYGRAVDIAALDDIPIYGHQQESSVTARAIKQILLLPAEMLPNQVISLLGFGGPSFPLADHYDHIHIGY